MRADPEIDGVGAHPSGPPTTSSRSRAPARRESRRPEALRRVAVVDRLERQGGRVEQPLGVGLFSTQTRRHERRLNRTQQAAWPIDLRQGRRSVVGLDDGVVHACAVRPLAGLVADRWTMRQVRIDGVEPAVVAEPQHDQVHDRDPPASGDRPQPLEREVRIRLSRQECLERPRRSVLEWISTRRNCRVGVGQRRPNADSAKRVDSDRRRMPTVRRQPSGGRRSRAAIIAFPASTAAAAAMFAPIRTSIPSAAGGRQTLSQAEPIIIPRSAARVETTRQSLR